MTAHAVAIDAIFADPNMATDAVWYASSGGAGTPCRIILSRPDEIGTYGESRLVNPTTRFDVRVSEIAGPCQGDLIQIGEESFRLQGDPTRDRLRLVWRCAAEPA